jgi:prepilin-type processing-associated H-X9-DG protein
MTILELLVAMGVVAVLLSLVLPAVQQVREAARNQQCTHNLRQIGIALHSYHNVYGRLPAGWRVAGDGRSAFGWRTALLPHLEQASLLRVIERRSSISRAAESVAPATAVDVCPSDYGGPTFQLFAEGASHQRPGQAGTNVLATLPRSNYVAVFGNSDPDDVPGETGEGAFIAARGMRFRDLQRGLTQVVLVGERTTRKLPSTWLGFDTGGEDAPGRVAGSVMLGPNRADSDECDFESRHPGHVNFLWADGHVRAMADGIDQSVYRASGRRN